LNGTYKYDFTTDSSQVYGGTAGYKLLAPGKWGMPAGDATPDGEINLYDKLKWRTEAGIKEYKASDFNMDGQVDNNDKNEFWIPNISVSCQVPE
jgi:hypothetical protein